MIFFPDDFSVDDSSCMTKDRWIFFPRGFFSRWFILYEEGQVIFFPRWFFSRWFILYDEGQVICFPEMICTSDSRGWRECVWSCTGDGVCVWSCTCDDVTGAWPLYVISSALSVFSAPPLGECRPAGSSPEWCSASALCTRWQVCSTPPHCNLATSSDHTQTCTQTSSHEPETHI